MFCLFFCFLFPCAPRLQSLWRRDSILPDLEACGECHADKQRSKQSELIFQGDLRTQRSLKVVPLLAQFLYTIIPQQQLSPGVSDRKHPYLHVAFHQGFHATCLIPYAPTSIPHAPVLCEVPLDKRCICSRERHSVSARSTFPWSPSTT